MRRASAVVAVTFGLGALGGCGGGGDDPPPTTVTTEPAPTTTLAAGDAQGIACLKVSTRALSLLNDYRAQRRGVALPDYEAFAADAEVLRAEHAELGCPGELLKGFPPR